MILFYAAVVYALAWVSGIENRHWLWLLIGIQSLTSLFLFTFFAPFIFISIFR
jgi:hypothetical protein